MFHDHRSVTTTTDASPFHRHGPMWLGAALALAAVLALLPVAASARPDTSAKTTTVTVKIRDTSFVLSSKKAPPGTVAFSVVNLGKAVHNFSIGGKKTPALRHGRKARLVVTFKKAGRYAYRSTIKGNSKRLNGVFVVTAAPKPSVPGNVAAGETVFKANCVACHTLKQAGAVGTIGPNLNTLKLAYAVIVGTVTHGKTGAKGTMPPLNGTLSATQIKNVAAFVYSAQHS